MKTGKILYADFCAGRKHDFRLFKESLIELPPHVLLLADAGYQGMAAIHANSQTPIKKPNCIRWTKSRNTAIGRCLENAALLNISSANSKCSAF
jgi:hypothetical protein